MKIKAETGFGSRLAYRGPFVYRVDEDGGLSLRYHFSGKEDPMTDFFVPQTDFGARHLSPALRSWMVPDPMSEKYYGISPYSYCGGNPVMFVDPDGEASMSFNSVDKDNPKIEINIVRNAKPSMEGGYTFDNYYNLSNTLNDHEGFHNKQWLELKNVKDKKGITKSYWDRRAVHHQMLQSSWKKTTEGHKTNVLNYISQ